MRGVYATRRTALVAALARHAPDVALSGLAAGFHAIVGLPGGATAPDVIEAARTRQVGLYGTAEYGGPDDELLLGFGNTPERAITAGIAAIGDLLHS
jgi:GntR family transcriptional regulator/MocR family aminotransferase